MKKKLLFVIPSLEAGGAEKSLVNLLNTINFERHEVDVLLFKNAGLFLRLVPKEVRIIALEDDYTTFTQPFFSSVTNFAKQGKMRLALSRLAFTSKIPLSKTTE